MKRFDFKHMTPLRWVLIGLAVVGLAGLVYWLLLPTAKKIASSPMLNTLNNLVNKVIQVSPDDDYTTVDGTDQGSGNYTANPSWLVGDYGAESGVDYEGNAFVRDSAPTIPFEAKVRPYLHGVDYYFPEQTAKGVTLYKRFPEFALADVKIHSMGPWFSDASANAQFSRGITTITTLPNFRNGGPQDVKSLPANRKNTMLPDDVFWVLSGSLANSLGSADPRYEALMALANNHELIADENAYIELGRFAWQNQRYTNAIDGQFSRYLSLDIEISSPYTNYRLIVGWLYKGFCSAAAEAGFTIRPFTYYGPEQVVIEGLSDRMGGSGDPEYLSEQFDFLANTLDPTIQAIAQFGGVFANDTYLQGIWGNEPLLMRDGNGTPQTDGGGFVLYNELSQTTAYGQTIPLEAGEAQKCLRDLYEQSTRLYLMNHRIAGQYPAQSGMRRSGLEGTKTGSFTRYTNEGVDGITHNDRPVPAWQLELFNALNLFLTQHLWCWGVDFNHEPDALGANHADTWYYGAYGVAESITKAAHRHAAFTNIQASAFKWCWFNLAMVNHMQTDGDGYHQKALCHAKIRNVNGTVWLEVLLAFPASDNRSTLFQVWVQQGSIQSEIFQCELPSGRHYFYDCFLLPSSFSYEQVEGENVYLTYPDTMNVPRYHRGDYRQSVDNVVAP
ncbi:hypothetical protein GO755_33365 [Spirosoma sp. HMF4905]|uniref:Uncharacterized protein n=1 Tax=Spirosoma arboris TaxID=2682092 RepID=A0A7K1SMD6_9BACT|nr:hypothetical protein [Spirosoma arboris]MVM34965.1 hypothetical protein [Spirosoma arboris]